MDYEGIALTHAVGGNLIMSADGKELLYVSDCLASFLGYSQEKVLECTKKQSENLIYPNDKEAVMRSKEKQLQQNNQYSVYYRIRLCDGRLIDVSEYGQRITEANNTYILANISKKNTVSDGLEHELSNIYSDSLTKLRNREYFEQYLETYFQNTDYNYALAMIDIDNFKMVNDTFGHTIGDEILCVTADVFRSVFSSDVVIARYGGDEFLIFLPQVDSNEQVKGILDELHAKFHEAVESYGKITDISLSIGVVMNNVMLSYDQLLKKVDVALYNAKATGKNKTVFYRDTLNFIVMNESRSYEDKSKYYNIMGKLASQLLEILANDNGTVNVLHEAISYIGEKFLVDKIMVMEKSLDGTLLYFTDYWCSQSKYAAPKKAREYLVLKEFFMPEYHNGYAFIDDIDSLANEFDRNRLKKFDVRQLLNCEIYQGKEVIGYLCFDVCNDHKLTPVETQALIAASQIIGEHIRLRRSVHTIEEHNNVMIRMFNKIDQFILVVNGKTMKVEFFNSFAKNRIPELENGYVLSEILQSAIDKDNNEVTLFGVKYRIDSIEWNLNEESYIIF